MTDVFLTALVLALVFAGGLALLQAAYAVVRLRKRTDLPTLVAFVGVTVSASAWALSAAFEFEAASTAATIFWWRVGGSGTLLLSVAWPLFVLFYTRPEFDHRSAVAAMLSVIPGMALVALWVPDLTHLYAGDVTTATVGSATVVQATGGPLGTANLLYAYAVYPAALVLLAWGSLRATGVIRRQIGALFVAGAVPLAVDFLATTGILASPPMSYTPVAFAVSTPLVTWALLKGRLFDLVPIVYKQILEEMDDGLVVLDQAHRIVHVNATGEAILDTSSGQATGGSIEAFVGAHPAADLAALIDPETDVSESEIVLIDGETPTVFDVKVSYLGSPDGTEGTILVFRDVTDKRTAQRRFQAIVENTSNLVTVLDQEGFARYISPKMEDLLGYSPTDLVGEDLFDLVHPEDREATYAELERCLEAGHARAEYRIQHEDGSWRRFESVAESFVDDPVLDGVVVTSWDVTAHRNYEQRLQVQNRVLRHDLRNDVNVIHGNAGLLLDELAGTEYADRIETILRKAEELDDLGERARTIDRVLHGEGGPADADLVDLLSARIDRAANEHSLATFDVVLDDDLAVAVPSQVEAVFDDLLENAVVHNDRDAPHVQVWTSEHELNGVEYVNVHVADDGPGIGRMTRRVFESETETQLEHSPGLGLWLVRWIVESADGALDIGEVQPRGTVVTVTFPRSGPPEDRIESRLPMLDD